MHRYAWKSQFFKRLQVSQIYFSTFKNSSFFRRMYEKKDFPEDIISELGEIVGPLATHCMIVEELIMLEDQLRKN